MLEQPRLHGLCQQVVTDLESVIRDLEQKLADAEKEIERLQDALVDVDVHIIMGFIVITHPAEDDTYIAACPSLHAAVQEPSQKEALLAVLAAMEAAWDALTDPEVSSDGQTHRGLPEADERLPR